MSAIVQDNPEQFRFEVHQDGQLAGFVQYQLGRDQIAFTHTEVDDAFAGQGLGRVLVAGALDEARRRGLAVLPFCPYVRGLIAKNPEQFLDLVPVAARAQFDLPN